MINSKNAMTIRWNRFVDWIIGLVVSVKKENIARKIKIMHGISSIN